MKASIGLELIGDSCRQRLRALTKLGKYAAYGPKFKPIPDQSWVAEIQGPDPVYKLKRVFLQGKKSYQNATGSGSRGVYMWYVLESGRYYEIKRNTSWRKTERYFVTVTGEGDIVRVNEKDVFEWAKSISA